jgi:tRNA(fMet)-specific endonuclease VapC
MPAGLMHRFVQHAGRLYLPTVVLAELYAWAYRRQDPASILERIKNDLLVDVGVLAFDGACAEQFGMVQGTLLRQGLAVNRVDLMIACVALTHDLTLVTHNTADFQHVPNLRLEDWLAP